MSWTWRLSVLAAAVWGGAAAWGQDRVEVPFQITYDQTQVGQSVFVLGSLPELGAGDISRSIKLEPSQWPVWRAVVSLPAGRSYTYQFYRRNDGPGTGGSTAGTVAIGPVVSASTPPIASEPARKSIVCHSSFGLPIVHWREAGSGAAYESRAMVPIAPGRSAGESRFVAWELSGPGGLAGRTIEFYFANAAGTLRDPAGSATYWTSLDAMMVQDANVYAYVPAAAPGAWRRAYNPSSPPSISSTSLSGETRRYRVLLPRGYDQHVGRRYPVLYMHDGQNVFEIGPFGSWNAHVSWSELIRTGRMREVIVVGVDNTANRFTNYVTPDDGGQADRYVRFIRDELKPLIDSQYRTLTGPEDTGAIGSSLGGVVSLYMGWDFTASFGRIGAMSGSWQLTGFPNRVKSQAKRGIRLYLDSGDAGASNDNYWPTLNLRDNLMARAPGDRYALEGDLRHRVGLGQQHNEAAWAARLPEALTFLFPAREEENPLVGLASGAVFERDGDGAVTVEDLYRHVESPADVNMDGSVDGWDGATVRAYVRRGEGGR